MICSVLGTIISGKSSLSLLSLYEIEKQAKLVPVSILVHFLDQFVIQPIHLAKMA